MLEILKNLYVSKGYTSGGLRYLSSFFIAKRGYWPRLNVVNLGAYNGDSWKFDEFSDVGYWQGKENRELVNFQYDF